MLDYPKVKYSSLRLKFDTLCRFKKTKPKRITHDDFLNELMNLYDSIKRY